jgi:hypothetical protein
MRLLAPFVLASLLVGCGGTASPPATAGHDKPPEAPPEPEKPFLEIPPHQAIGEPRAMKDKAPAAWWVWMDESGLWHVRTTTASGAHRFRGKIKAATGFVTDVAPTKEALKSRIQDNHHGLVVDFQTDREMDGLDFRTSDGGCVRLNLLVDGGPHPKRVFVGEKMMEPPHAHFQLCPLRPKNVPAR